MLLFRLVDLWSVETEISWSKGADIKRKLYILLFLPRILACMKMKASVQACPHASLSHYEKICSKKKEKQAYMVFLLSLHLKHLVKAVKQWSRTDVFFSFQPTAVHSLVFCNGAG